MDLTKFEVPKHRIAEDFQSFCEELFYEELGDDSIKEYGERGHKQHGIDIYSPKTKTGIQVKVRSENKNKFLTVKDIKEDLERAQSAPFPIDTLIFATTSETKKEIEDYVFELNATLPHTSRVKTVKVYFWREIVKSLSEHLGLYNKHFTSESQKLWFKASVMLYKAAEFIDQGKLDTATTLLDEVDVKKIKELDESLVYLKYKTEGILEFTKNRLFTLQPHQHKAAALLLEACQYNCGDPGEKLLTEIEGLILMDCFAKAKEKLHKILENNKTDKAMCLLLELSESLEEFTNMMDQVEEEKLHKKDFLLAQSAFYLNTGDDARGREKLEQCFAFDPDDLFIAHEINRIKVRQLEKKCKQGKLNQSDQDQIDRIIVESSEIWELVKPQEVAKYRTAFLALKATAYTLKCDFNKVYEAYCQAIEKTPESTYLMSHLCLHATLAALDISEYESAFKHIVNCDENFVEAKNLFYAATLFHLGKFNEANALYEECCKSEIEWISHQAKEHQERLFTIEKILDTTYFLFMTKKDKSSNELFLQYYFSEEFGVAYEHAFKKQNKIVGPNMSVDVQVGDEIRTFILEDNKKIKGDNIISSQAPLFSRLKGKAVGEAVVVAPTCIPPEKGIIKNIKSKYAGVCNYREFFTKHEDITWGYRGKIGRLETKEDFDTFMKQLEEASRRFFPNL